MNKLFCLMVSLCFSSGVLFGNTFYVSTTGSATPPYDTWATAANDIQVAVDLTTSSSDTVIVGDGTYTPSSEIVISNSITVASANGADAVIIDGNNAHRCFNLRDPYCEISGFTITKGYNDANGGGIDNTDANNCMIIDNTATYGGGGVAYGTINDCIVSDNIAHDSGGYS